MEWDEDGVNELRVKVERTYIVMCIGGMVTKGADPPVEGISLIGQVKGLADWQKG